MSRLIYGLLLMAIAQIGTFFQLQGGTKYDWFSKYPIICILVSLPLGLLYILSTKELILSFDGEMWPSRLIGFGIGIIIFAVMSNVLFKEPINLKTIISIFLALIIIFIQTIK